MNNKVKIFGILLLAGFSFFYTKEVSKIIKNNDPIMKEIINVEDDMQVSKVDPIIINDEYITGINGCKVDEVNSYNKMKDVGAFKEDLIVMKEDKIRNNDLYIIGGNKKKRNISILFTDYDKKINKFLKNNKIKVNYFLDGKYIIDNVDTLISIKNYSNIYSYGRNKEYLKKYMSYDNTIIYTNFNNNSSYCLFEKKNNDYFNNCTSNNMKSIKVESINENILTYTKEELSNGKIFLFNSKNYDEITTSIKYILSKGYKIVSLDDLLDESNSCN